MDFDLMSAVDQTRLPVDRFNEQVAMQIARQLVDKVAGYERLHLGLLNATAEQGYYIDEQAGRWFVQSRGGLNMFPQGGFHSLEDALACIFDDVRAKAKDLSG